MSAPRFAIRGHERIVPHTDAAGVAAAPGVSCSQEQSAGGRREASRAYRGVFAAGWW